MGVGAAELVLDLGLGEVNRGRDDVGRQLAAQLDDVFAEIGLDRRDAVAFEEVVEADLLGDHRLALGHCLRADMLWQMSRTIWRASCAVSGIVHMAALGEQALLIGFEIEIEVGKRVVLDVARGVAQRLEFGQAVRHLAPPRDEVHFDEAQRVLQVGVGQRRPGIVLEARRGRDVGSQGHRCAPVLAPAGLLPVGLLPIGVFRSGPAIGLAPAALASAASIAGRPIAGSWVMPASTSAT